MEKDTAISTLNDYLTWVKEKRLVPVNLDIPGAFPLVDDLRKNLYFRGQSDETWMITPALYRYRFNSENEWLKMAAMRTWQETYHLSNLNKLITFQHYGLKTRLLDVTRNPLVALYFACLSSQEKQETDGAVYYGHNDKDNSISAECLADILFFFGYSQGDTYSMKEVKTKVSDRNVVAKEYLPDLREILCSPHFIKAPMNNPRISAQQGAFIMAPFLTERPGEKGKKCLLGSSPI
ncbi:MAG: FRG domain-containing protein [Lachnospiraceae bacterium]|nr:FRG domain-containing protein [Lachnospiraceae bacterium]